MLDERMSPCKRRAIYVRVYLTNTNIRPRSVRPRSFFAGFRVRLIFFFCSNPFLKLSEKNSIFVDLSRTYAYARFSYLTSLYHYPCYTYENGLYLCAYHTCWRLKVWPKASWQRRLQYCRLSLCSTLCTRCKLHVLSN